MLNFSGNVNILGLLSILEIYYDDLDEVMAENIIYRLFSDINSSALSNREKNLVLFWITNLNNCFLNNLTFN